MAKAEKPKQEGKPAEKKPVPQQAAKPKKEAPVPAMPGGGGMDF